MSLLVWLPLNGNLENLGLADITVTNNGAIIENNGKIGQCYNFNSASSCLIGNFTPGVIVPNELSFSCWVKLTVIDKTHTLFCSRKVVGAGLSVFILNTNKLRFDNGSDTKNTSYQTTFDYIFTSNTWYHITVVLTTTLRKLYINGILQLSVNKTSNNLGNNTATLYSIGASLANGSSYDNYLSGYLNDVRIYNHALSDKEIKEIYKSLVLHYKLDGEGFGSSNLLPCGGTYTINNPWITTSNKTDGYVWVTNSAFEGTPSTTYTISIECDGNLTNSHGNSGQDPTQKLWTLWLYICNIDTTKNWSGGLYDSAINLTNSNYNYRRIGNTHIWTYTLSSTQKYISLRTNSYSDGSTNLTIKWWNMKIEANNEYTPWIPNNSNSLYTALGLNNNIIYDLSGYNHNGIVTGNFILSSDTPRYNCSTGFNHSLYISVGTLLYNIKDEITVSLWCKKDWSANTGTPLSCIEGGGFGWQCLNANDIDLLFACGTGVSSNSYAVINLPTSSLSAGWHMLSGSYNGLVLKAYIDGELINTVNKYSTKTPIYYNNNSGLFISGESAGSITTPSGSNTGSLFTGNISDVRIYATALSDADILELYHTSATIDNNGNVYARELVET